MEIEYRDPKYHTTQRISVVEVEGKPYFRLEDILCATLPGIISEHLILNSLYPAKGEVCLADYLTIEWIDEDDFRVLPEDPIESRKEPWALDSWVCVGKNTAIALLLDKNEEYANEIAYKIINTYGLTEEDKHELYMLETHLWNMTEEEYKQIDRVADFKQRAIARKRQGEDIYNWLKDNFDEVLDC